MRVLVGCEYSGRVREAFRALGHEAWSCDLDPAEDGSPHHLQDDLLKVIKNSAKKTGRPSWDLMIAHPPCTYLCGSGMHWTTRGLRDPQLTEDALEFFLALYHCDIPKVVLENPVGIISTRFRKFDQMIQPYQFGDDASKRTCLWVRGVDPLVIPPESEWHPPRMVYHNGKLAKRWGNQGDSGRDNHPENDRRAKDRSRTFPGIAKAMAIQWGVC